MIDNSGVGNWNFLHENGGKSWIMRETSREVGMGRVLL